MVQKHAGAEFPFTLICDAPGVLYGYLGVEQARGILSWSFAAQRIYKRPKSRLPLQQQCSAAVAADAGGGPHG